MTLRDLVAAEKAAAAIAAVPVMIGRDTAQRSARSAAAGALGWPTVIALMALGPAYGVGAMPRLRTLSE